MRRKTIKKNFWFSYEEDKQLKYLSSILNLSESNTIRKLLYETQIKELELKLLTLHDKDVNYKEDNRYMAIEKEIENLQSQVNSIVNEDTTEKINKLKELDEKISEEKQVILQKNALKQH